MRSAGPVGLFDSGVGGLTVYRALREKLPCEDLLYVGDTARVPYGTKSPDTVRRYAREISAFLIAQGVKMLVVACNTATAHALESLREDWPDVPIIGVIEPGAQAAIRASRQGKILVMATEGTVASGAYPRALAQLAPDVCVEGLACNLLVGLAEEGWAETEEARAVIRRYLEQVRMTDYDTVILGCTHFPLMRRAIASLVPGHVTLVDSAHTTAEAVAACLAREGLANRSGRAGTDRLMVTDGLPRVRQIMRHMGGFFNDSMLFQGAVAGQSAGVEPESLLSTESC